MSRRRIAAAIGAVILLYYLNIWFDWVTGILEPSPVDNGILFLVFVYAAYVLATDDEKIWNAVVGADGRASTSKFQPFLWTVVVLFAYVVITSVRFEIDPASSLPEIPTNVLLVLGLAFATGIEASSSPRTGSTWEGTFARPPLIRGRRRCSRPMTDTRTLYKIQTLAFTFIGVGVYVAQVFTYVGLGQAPESLPDIPEGLLFLMGIGSAAYLSKKLSGNPVTFLASITPQSVRVSAANAGRTVTITGANFGPSQGTSLVSIGGVALQSPTSSWSDTSITFVVPEAQPDGQQWPQDQPLEVRVARGLTKPQCCDPDRYLMSAISPVPLPMVDAGAHHGATPSTPGLLLTRRWRTSHSLRMWMSAGLVTTDTGIRARDGATRLTGHSRQDPFAYQPEPLTPPEGGKHGST